MRPDPSSCHPFSQPRPVSVLGVRRGELEWAEVDGHHVAFREYLGDGGVGHEVMRVNRASFPMGSLPDDPVAARLVAQADRV